MIEVYKAKDGWRWRLIIDGNVRCVGTDPKLTKEEAIADAVDVLTYTIDGVPEVWDERT